MGLFTDNVNNKSGQSAKIGQRFLQSKNFATFSVPSNSLAPNMTPYVSRLFGFINNLWDPFVTATAHNNLLPSGSKASVQNFDDNYGSFVDSTLPSHCFSNQNANFEQLSDMKMNSLISNLNKGSGISIPNIMNFITSDFAKILLEENINVPTCPMKSILHPDVTKMQVLENNLAFFKEQYFVTKHMCDNSNNTQVNLSNNTFLDKKKIILSSCTQMSQVKENKNLDIKNNTKTTSVQKIVVKTQVCALPKKVDKNMDMLNQELTLRKNKKMTKHSKKKRRRQKKKVQAAENLNLESELYNQSYKVSNNRKKKTDHSSSKLHKVDDFSIVFEERLPCDNLITTSKEKEKAPVNSILSFIFCQSSNDESDSDFDSDCDISTVTTEDIFDEDFGGGLNSLCIMQSSLVIGDVSKVDDAAEIGSELKGINIQWQNATAHISSEPKVPSKVTFAPEEDLLHVFPVENYDRKGEWEIYALERCRFKKRIETVEYILSPFLSLAHRAKIQSRL